MRTGFLPSGRSSPEYWGGHVPNISKRFVDTAPPGRHYDDRLPGFGVYVGRARISYFVEYRSGRGRSGRVRRYTFARHGEPAPGATTWTAERAPAITALQPLVDGREIWDGNAGCGMPFEDGDAASVRVHERPATPPSPSARASGGGTARTGAAGPGSGRCRSSGRSVASSRCRVFHATSQSEMPIR